MAELSSWAFNYKSTIVPLLANDQLFPGAHPFPILDRRAFSWKKSHIAVVERTCDRCWLGSLKEAFHLSPQ